MPVLIFRAFGRKNKLLGNGEKTFKEFLVRIAKKPLFKQISLKTLTNPALTFRAFGRQAQIAGKF